MSVDCSVSMPAMDCGPPSEISTGAAVNLGTTIMAVQFEGGVVVCGDSRVTMGSFVTNRAGVKLIQMSEKIFVAKSGGAADTEHLSAYVRRYLEQHAIEKRDEPTVRTAASLMQLLCYENKEHVVAGLIVGGWDRKRGPQIYQIPLGGSSIQTKYALGGSGSSYISAFVKDNYRDNMNKEECVNMVKKAVAYAAKIDGSSGGLIRMVVITKDQVEQINCIASDIL